MYKIQRFEGKVVGIEIDGCKSIPPSMENTDFQEWRRENPDIDLSDQPYEKPLYEKRFIGYEQDGVNMQAMTVALWEYVVENRPEVMNALQSKRQAIKDKYPKPK